MHSLTILSFFGAATWAVTTYDYVIVGGGTTGLVVANRLTEDTSSMSILLVHPTLDAIDTRL
jgi:ribulose 1,5-bisphosphate synthetase/thiazole synthase